jgi:protein-S-isoprenylcysteine O-methyltransferase Ste14
MPQLGRRGGGWAILQGLLISAVLLSALVGLGWPGGLEIAASIVGGLLAALGVLLLVGGALQLGSSLTPLPAPRAGGELTTTGLYGRARHPMYGGGILFALGWSTIFASRWPALTVLLAPSSS